jgi:hypothetical protein
LDLTPIFVLGLTIKVGSERVMGAAHAPLDEKLLTRFYVLTEEQQQTMTTLSLAFNGNVSQ